MYKPKTLFVLGAGASAEVDFPIGWELAQRIANSLRFRFDFGEMTQGEENIRQAIRLYCKASQTASDALYQAAARIADGISSALSIDEFIDRCDGDTFVRELGKAAIVFHILKAERDCWLYVNHERKVQWSDVDTTWYAAFAYYLFQGLKDSQIDGMFKDITVISFNYDRCLQQFLAHAINRAYKLQLDHAHALVRTLKIINPYGDLGTLEECPFGHSPHAMEVFTKSEKIRTFTEATENKEAQDAIVRAENIIFLGFRFYADNMRVLKPNRTVKTKAVLATGFGLSAFERGLKEAELQIMCGPKLLYLENMKCRKLFDEYGMALSLK